MLVYKHIVTGHRNTWNLNTQVWMHWNTSQKTLWISTFGNENIETRRKMKAQILKQFDLQRRQAVNGT
jgi:hypothetical protein